MLNLKVALIGTPNVGKSTIYNALTKSNVHTGNWAGKTVEFSKGICSYENVLYEFYDLPGTYSLISKSREEQVATDFICFKDYDVALVVVDATSLEKGINLVIQTKELSKNVVVALNLMDEAQKLGIDIDIAKLEENLDCPVVGVSAKNKVGLTTLLKTLKEAKGKDYLILDYKALNESLKEVEKYIITSKINKRWIALRILENNSYYLEKFQELNYFTNKEDILKIQNELEIKDVSLEIVMQIMKNVRIVLKDVVKYPDTLNTKRLKIDKVLTSKIWGIPLMLLLLFFLFYLTISASNYPSDLLFKFFSSLEDNLINILEFIKFPSWLISLLVNGIYKTLYWVISVMLPPMLIFFPLFSFLEDLGVLPRIAFNLDNAFLKCQTCGKQALTMCMGIGCNAVGVTGARIIDSKRERLIAILTNAFMPCNGKFPTLIAISMMFLGGLSKSYGNLLCALILTLLIFIGIIITFIISYILSKTILKGLPSSFTLELPPFRMPKVFKTIFNSIKNKAIYVLIRAIKVAIPAGLIIWLLANLKINNNTLIVYFSNFLNPIGRLFGLDGVIILAFLLGFPANEIIVPSMLMGYLKTTSLIDIGAMEELKNVLIINGWNIKRAICFLMLMLFHYPCSTTLLTIKKETNSNYYTFLAFIIPLGVGLIICLLINLIF